MDRASDSGSEGWGFESLPVCHKKEERAKALSSFLFVPGKGLENKIQAAGGSLATAGWTAVGQYNFAKQNWTSPFRCTPPSGGQHSLSQLPGL